MATRIIGILFPILALACAGVPAHAFESDARQAILIDSTNDSTLYVKDGDTTFPPASLAKLMTLAVTFDHIKRGWLTPSAPLKMSEHAWRTGGAPARTTTMFARVNSEVSVRDLVRGVAIVVANDGAIALGEGIAETEKKFAALMNDTASRIGMKSSLFVNASGLPAPGQQTTVRDLGILAQHIVTAYPDMYSVFSEEELDFGGILQLNRNPMLGHYTGADGMMIGSVEGEGHMIAVSAVRDGKRLIAVLAGLPDEKARVRAATALLDWGFTGYIDRDLFEAGETVGHAQMYGGTQGSVPLVAQQAITLPVPKDGNARIIARVHYRGPITAPVRKGDRIGVLRITRNGQLQREVPLVAAQDVAEGSMLQRALDATYELIAGPLYQFTSKLFPRV